MFKILVFLFVAVAAVQAYDFSDVDFNQYLFDEFQSLDEDVTFNRQRRDAVEEASVPEKKEKECGGHRHGEGKKDHMCCGGDKFNPEHFKKMQQVRRMCASKLRANNTDVESFDPFDCEKMNRIKQLIICEGECFARAINVLDESGKLNREAILKRFVDHLVDEAEWKRNAYEGYVDKCLAQVESKAQEADQQCSSAPLEFHHCIWGEFINGCPSDLRVDSHKCNKLRERHNNGSGFLNKHALHGFFHGRGRGGYGSEQKETESF